MLEEANVVQTTQEDFQFPPSNREEYTEGHETHVQMPDQLGDMVQGAVPTSLPPLETSHAEELQNIYRSMKVSLVCLKVRCLNIILHININT